MVSIDKLIEVLQWVNDAHAVRGDYLSFPLVSQQELDELCDLFNENVTSDKAISNMGGEILLGSRKAYLEWKNSNHELKED